MDEVFLDSSWFKAIVDEKDEFFARAGSILARLEENKSKFVTTNYIIDETFTLIRAKCGREKCQKFAQYLQQIGNLHIERVQASDERRYGDWFWNDWSKLSYTDCTCFAVMERLGIKQVATFDEHFAQAGFRVV